ncbi:ferredoxin [Streptomyces sp. NPDC091280]|uniref:ferredoxin n=1 Tax=Streptomyces sp. NPDC091280 TaxID=3365984 RepID=UPI0037FF9F9D
MTAAVPAGAVRVTADRDVCVGGGLCVRVAPGVFDQAEHDGRVVVLVPEPSAAEAPGTRRAVALCPVHALALTAGRAARGSAGPVAGAVLPGGHAQDGPELP